MFRKVEIYGTQLSCPPGNILGWCEYHSTCVWRPDRRIPWRPRCSHRQWHSFFEAFNALLGADPTVERPTIGSAPKHTLSERQKTPIHPILGKHRLEIGRSEWKCR